MATLDAWIWPLAAGQQVSVKDRSRSNSFGDGSQQSVLEGINPFIMEVPCSWTGNVKTGNQILSFLKAHITNPFQMVPPHGELGLYTVKSGTIKYVALGRATMNITFTAEQAVGIYTGVKG